MFNLHFSHTLSAALCPMKTFQNQLKNLKKAKIIIFKQLIKKSRAAKTYRSQENDWSLHARMRRKRRETKTYQKTKS